jgi:hypothetical protein
LEILRNGPVQRTIVCILEKREVARQPDGEAFLWPELEERNVLVSGDYELEIRINMGGRKKRKGKAGEGIKQKGPRWSR